MNVVRVRDRITPPNPAVVTDQQRVAVEQANADRLKTLAARHLEEQKKFLADNQLTSGEKRIAAVKAQCTESTFRYIESKIKSHSQADRESGVAYETELAAWKEGLQESGQKVEGKV
jgi:hypothetical protein